MINYAKGHCKGGASRGSSRSHGLKLQQGTAGLGQHLQLPGGHSPGLSGEGWRGFIAPSLFGGSLS